MPLPRDPAFDNALAFLNEGYRFVSNRCNRFCADGFETRLLMRKAICVRGEAAARMFYTPGRFTRQGAAPVTTVMQLQDFGSVHAIDDEDHHHRKRMFLALMTPERLQAIADLTARHWGASVKRWEQQRKVVLHDEVEEILCRAVCDWSGIALPESEVRERTRELSATVEGAASVGPRGWKGLLMRNRSERWLRGIVDEVRAGQRIAAPGTALQVFTTHRDRRGELLPAQTVAVELHNILRPTVAVARFLTFAAHALHEYPECRAALQTGEDQPLEHFVQEVRRYYPFFPIVAGIVREPFDWHGTHFDAGTWVLMDLYGTNHDARCWPEPDRFLPERFQAWDGSAFNLVPQGAGDHYFTNRCPGEWMAIGLTKVMVRLLVSFMKYDVPAQDLRIDLRRIPAIPKSRMVIANVQRADER